MTTSSTPLPGIVAFENALDLEYLDGRNWRVLQTFYYDTAINIPTPRITVWSGFITDFASIPRVLWSLIPPIGSYGKAAVIHDWLYRIPGLATRSQADRVLLEAMTYLQVPRLTRWTLYLGVRFGGSAAWWSRRHTS